jgi:hypothetical protein
MAAKQPNCFECRHHFITHEPQRPYGCRKFGFKGPFLPSRMVFQETGMKCAYYEPSRRPYMERGPTGSNGRLA